MNNTLFPEYQENQNIKPIVRIGNLALVRYQKKEIPLNDSYEQAELDILPKERNPKKKRGITNERQAILKEILETINDERTGKPIWLKDAKIFQEKEFKKVNKLKPMSGRFLAIKLSHIPTQDLYYMKSQGLDYRQRTGQPFGKYIFGSIKVKKDI